MSVSAELVVEKGIKCLVAKHFFCNEFDKFYNTGA